MASLTSDPAAVYFAEGRMECEAGQHRSHPAPTPTPTRTPHPHPHTHPTPTPTPKQAGQYRRAAELLELAHSVSGSAAALVSAANMHHKLGELAHAEALYTQASPSYPPCPNPRRGPVHPGVT